MSHRRSLLLVGLFGAACPAPKSDELDAPAPFAVGTVDVCTEIPAGDDTLHTFSGVVVAIDDGSTECSQSVTIETAEGERHTVGWTVTSDEAGDYPVAAELEEGRMITLGIRSYMVFGDVRGLVITDDEGLVLAADEGTWGGGLRPDETGLSMEPGGVIWESRTECVTTSYISVSVVSDHGSIGLEPFEKVSMGVGDAESVVGVDVMLVASIEYGPGEQCSVSDQTDELAWVAWR